MRGYARARSVRHRKDGGQALILVVIALLVLCLGVIVLFNTGQSVTKKVQLVNAADAAAYSAAVQQARAYNLIAYMNRASVANEVAVAQMVSIYSYTNYYLNGTKNLHDAAQDLADIAWVAGLVPGLEELWAVAGDLEEAASYLEKAKDVVEKARDAMQPAFTSGVDLLSGALNRAYSDVSEVVAAGAAADADLLARQVVKANTDGQATIPARMDLIWINQGRQALQYAERYKLSVGSPSSQADRYANVVMEARDGFSRERNGQILGSLLKKRGGTDIVTTRYNRGRRYDAWVGADTLDFYLHIGFGWFSIKKDWAWAWGGAAALRSGAPGGFRNVALQGYDNGKGWTSPYEIDQGKYFDHDGPHYDRYSGAVDNRNAGKDVLNSPAVDGTGKAWLKGYQGLQDYNDVAADKATVPYVVKGESAASAGVDALDAGPVFTVLAAQSMNTVHTANNVTGIGGPPDFQAPDKAVSDGITALASAQVYFDRPRSLFPSLVSPGKRELGNLFSPYWQARLVDTPCSVRQEVALSYGSVATCL